MRPSLKFYAQENSYLEISQGTEVNVIWLKKDKVHFREKPDSMSFSGGKKLHVPLHLLLPISCGRNSFMIATNIFSFNPLHDGATLGFIDGVTCFFCMPSLPRTLGKSEFTGRCIEHIKRLLASSARSAAGRYWSKSNYSDAVNSQALNSADEIKRTIFLPKSVPASPLKEL